MPSGKTLVITTMMGYYSSYYVWAVMPAGNTVYWFGKYNQGYSSMDRTEVYVPAGDDSLLVKVSGKELSIVSESSGFEGKASFKGTSLEGLNDAVLRAVKDLSRKTEAERR